MCLATVYKENDDSVIFKNVSRINVEGDKLILRDIMGDERVVEGSILMVDLANSIVKVKCDCFFSGSSGTGVCLNNRFNRLWPLEYKIT